MLNFALVQGNGGLPIRGGLWRAVDLACGRQEAVYRGGLRTTAFVRGRKAANGRSRYGSLQKERLGFWGPAGSKARF